LTKLFISVSGKATLSNDKLEMLKHWSKDLNVWFKDRVDTKGLMMIKVEAKHMKYWSNNEEGEVSI
jgi:general stress protein 26